jgi:adenylate kinase family enzyme
MSRFVVISGLPASGKSAVGRIIAENLTLPLLDKDEFLEPLLQLEELPDGRRRGDLSRDADELFRARALAEREAVLISWWRHPQSPDQSGTPSEWLPSLPGKVVEVFCECRPTVAVERFLTRKRHPGHLDALRTQDQLMEQFNRQAPLGPLGVGVLVTVNTNAVVDTEALISRINRAFG